LAFEVKENLPYCPGCGHHMIVHSTMKAFKKLGWEEKDVILVTDIGCVGLADKYFPCHTVHCLHGRSVALAGGIRFGLRNSEKHIVIFLGDGGATIGLQHLLEAARLNVRVTVIIHNNMVYGMTGGQSSGLTPEGYKTTTEPQGSDTKSYDLCLLAHQSGASYSSRVTTGGDLVESFTEAFSEKGFSLVEVVENCFSYGYKHNPEHTLKELMSSMNLEVGTWRNTDRFEYRPELKDRTKSLLKELPSLEPDFNNFLDGRELSVLIAGSAGEGVQTAASVLSKAAVLCGLEVAKKGEYPVTVGSGFSAVKILLSNKSINYTGFQNLDVAIITSREGLLESSEMVGDMSGGQIYLDSSLSPISADADLARGGYRNVAGKRGAALCAITDWVNRKQVIPVEALSKAANISKHAESLKKSIKSAENIKL